MLAARRHIVALCCWAGCVTLAADEQPRETAPGEGLESAGRDIKNLQAGQPKVGHRTAVPEDPVPLPFVMPSSSGTASASPAGSGNSGSQGWLLDALQDQQQRSRFRSNPSSRGELDVPPLRQEDRPNPLNGYLQTWLSPRDRELLVPGGDRGVDGRTSLAGSAEPVWRPRSSIDASGLTADARRGHKLAPASNPYLDTAPASIAPAELIPPRRQPNTLGSMPAVVLPPSATQGSSLPELGSPSVTEPVAPPTAPLIDERRYFPQLRRF